LCGCGFTALCISLEPRAAERRRFVGRSFFLSLATQNIGLETIAANRAGFLIGLNVVMVPLLGPLVGYPFSSKALFSGAIALCGLGLMSWENGSFAIGDLWMVACALCYTLPFS
jgi:hypothetical protein